MKDWSFNARQDVRPSPRAVVKKRKRTKRRNTERTIGECICWLSKSQCLKMNRATLKMTAPNEAKEKRQRRHACLAMGPAKAKEDTKKKNPRGKSLSGKTDQPICFSSRKDNAPIPREKSKANCIWRQECVRRPGTSNDDKTPKTKKKSHRTQIEN